MNPKEKSLREILEDVYTANNLCPHITLKEIVKWREDSIDKALSAIEAHYKKQLEEISLKSLARLEGWDKANKKIIELQNKYKTRQLSRTEIFNEIAKEIGFSLTTNQMNKTAIAIFKKQEEKDK